MRRERKLFRVLKRDDLINRRNRPTFHTEDDDADKGRDGQAVRRIAAINRTYPGFRDTADWFHHD